MITSLTDWTAFLRTTHGVVAIPLIVGGLALMLFGWRMWKVCVVLSFGLIGAAVGTIIADGGEHATWYGIGGALLLGLLSSGPVNIALALLGGLIGAGFFFHVLGNTAFVGPIQWVLAGVALFGFSGLAFINRQILVIGVTSVQGAVLLISGLSVCMMSMPALDGTLRAMSNNSMIVLPFVLLVPTVMSCFYQVAEVHRVNAEL